MDQVFFAVGVVVVAFTGASILFTMVLPRSPRGFERLSVTINRIVRLSFLAANCLPRCREKNC